MTNEIMKDEVRRIEESECEQSHSDPCSQGPSSFDEWCLFTDRRDMRDCRVGGGWRLIYCYSEKTLIPVGLMEEEPGG